MIPKIFNLQIVPLIGPAGCSQSFKEGNPLGGYVGGREQSLILQSMLAACQSTPEEFRSAAPRTQPHLGKLSDDRACIPEAATGTPCAVPGWFVGTPRCSVNSKYQFSILTAALSGLDSMREEVGEVCLFHSNISKWFILIIFRLQYVASYVKCTLKSN